MKVAHWSKVTKSLATKYGLSWDKAKSAYKALKESSPRTPSLRMVSALPAKIPSKLKGVRSKNPAKGQRAEPTKKAVPTLPPNMALAPPKPLLGPRPVPSKQGTRNKFEEALKAQGLPVSAIARNETGKQISAKWRSAGEQEKLAKLLKQAYRQVERDGWMKEQTKKRIVDLMEKSFGVAKANPMWNNILRQLYGVSPKR